METIKQDESIKMYREYGISEWREKCLVLSDVDRAIVISDLSDEVETELTKAVKLPFPDFARVYLSNFQEIQSYLKDPAFGYKLYLLADYNLKIWISKLRGPDIPIKELCNKYNCSYVKDELLAIMGTSLENVPKTILSPITLFNDNFLKFIYLTQYIDTSKALELGLSTSNFFIQDGTTKGYDLEGKMDILNPVARTIIARTLGLYGYNRASSNRISEELNMSKQRIIKLQHFIIPLLILPLGVFKQKLGFKDDINSNNQGRHEYMSNSYRKMDIALEIAFIRSFCISPSEEIILSSINEKNATIYLVAKYFGWTTEQICRNLSITNAEIKSL